MNRLSPSALLSILLTSLLFIFIGPGEFRPLVGISVLVILILGVFLGFSGTTPAQQSSARRMLASLTGIVAVASSALMGQYLLNHRIGLLCAPVLVAAAYFGFLALVARSGVNVDEGEMLLIQRRTDHQHILRPPGLHSPLMPALETAVAVMPMYDIQTDIEVEHVDTSSLHKVDKVVVDTLCRITQHFPQNGELIPIEARYEGFLRLPYQYPNREREFRKLADARDQTIAEARMSADFWIAAIQNQLSRNVDEELRAVIHDETFYNPDKRTYAKLGPADISARRTELASLLKQRLQERVNQWGVEILDLGITQVILTPDRIKAFYGEFAKVRESQEVERKARDEAKQREILGAVDHKLLQERYTLDEEHKRSLDQIRVEQMIREQKAQANGASEMLGGYISTFLEQYPDMKPEDLKRLLLLAMEEHVRLQHRPELPPLP